MYLNSSGINGAGHVDVASYKVSTTTVIDSSRNLTNIGTISSGAITATNGNVTITTGYNLQWGSGYSGGHPSISATSNAMFFYPTGNVSGANFRLYASMAEIRDGNALRFQRAGNSAYGELTYDTGENITLYSSWGAKYLRFTRDGDLQLSGTTRIADNGNATLGTISAGQITSNGSVTAGNGSTSLGYYVGTTQVIQGSTRNLVNIGTITAGLTKLTPSGWNSPPAHAALNIGYSGSGETRAIDIDGGWSNGESKSITFTHGSSATNMVGQINVAHKPTTNTNGSSFRFGKLYHSGDSSTYTMELHSESTTLANLYINAGMVQIGHDGTYSNYGVVGFGDRSNGSNRIFGNNGTSDGLYLASATGQSIYMRPNGGSANKLTVAAGGQVEIAQGDITLNQDGTYGATYGTIGFGGTSNGYNRVFARNSTADGLYVASATGQHVVIRTNGSGNNTFRFTSSGELQMGSSNVTVIDSSRNLTNIASLTVAGSNGNVVIASSGNNITFSRNGDNYIEAQTSTSSNIVMNPQNRFAVHTNDTERLRVTSVGNLGLGTTNPSYAKLHVHDATARIRLEETTSGGSKRLDLSVGSDAIGRIGANQSASGLAFETTGSERMRISSIGRVGIGTTSLSADGLHIGTINGNCELDLDHSSGRRFRISSKSTGRLTFEDKDASAERMSISSAGDATFSGISQHKRDIRSAGQIRATGWYNDAASTDYTGLAFEIGISGSKAFGLSYNRSNATYGPMQFDATSFAFNRASTFNLMQGNLQIGGTTVIDSSRNLTNIAGIGASGTVSAGSFASNYGLSLNNGNTNFLLYNNTGENVLYMRDTTNGAMLQTWHTDKVVMNKNLQLSGTLKIGNTTAISSTQRFYASTGTSVKAAYSFDGESNTGWYKPAAGEIAFIGQGTERLHVRSTGELEIPNGRINLDSTTVNLDALLLGGTAQTSYTNMVLYSNSGNAQMWKAGTGYTNYGGASALNIYNSNGLIAFHPSATHNVAQIDNGGLVLGNTKTVEFKDDDGSVRGTINARSSAPHFRIATSNNEQIGFYDGTTENIRINGSGDLNLKTGSLEINGTAVIDTSRNLKNVPVIYSTAGNTAIELNHATYTMLSNPEGARCLYLGDSGDRGNYYDNTTHYFRTAGGSNIATIYGSGVINAYHSLQVNGTTFIDTNRNLTNIGNTSGTGSYTTEGSHSSFGTIRITNPKGADVYSRLSGQTGAIKITLPQSWTNTMMWFTIEVFEYSSNESFTVKVGGYNYSGSSAWVNHTATIISNGNKDRNFTVRFAHDGTKCCIFIGDLTSTWSYPQVAVTDFIAGFSNATIGNWHDGWDASFETSSYGTVSGTHYQTDSNIHHTNIKINGTEVIDASRNGVFVNLRADGGNLIMGDEAYSSSPSYVGMKTSRMSGGNDYMILSGTTDGNTYVSAQNSNSVKIRGGGNNSGNQIEVPDGSAITATTSNFYCTGNVTAYYSSDQSLKENIRIIDNPIEKIKQIRGVYFDWTDDYIKEQSNDGEIDIRKDDVGVIAQDVQPVLDEVVTTRNDGTLAVRYEKMIALCIEAIKEQQDQIDSLKDIIKEMTDGNN